MIIKSPLVLPIAIFTEAGMFAAADSKAASKQPPIHTFKLTSALVRCHYDARTETLEVTCPGDASVNTHFLQVTTDGIGRRYFLCDCCVARRTALVLQGEAFVCREFYVEHSKDNSKTMRRALFTMEVQNGANAKLVIPPPPNDPSVTTPPVFRTPSEGVASDPRAAALVRYSTSKAIDRGRGAGQYDAALKHRENKRDDWERFPTAPDFQRPAFSSLTDAHPRLNINEFAPRVMHEGKFTARTLCWGDRAGDHWEVLFLVDWREGDPIVIAIHRFQTDAEARRQRLPVALQVNNRIRWVCPVTGENVDTLYLRNGLLASREAQRLVSPSQRAGGRRKYPKEDIT